MRAQTLSKGTRLENGEPEEFRRAPSIPNLPPVVAARRLPRRNRFRMGVLIQRHASPDVSRHVEILSLVNRRFAFVETAFGDNLQWQLALPELWLFPPAASGFLTKHQLLELLGRQSRRRRNKP